MIKKRNQCKYFDCKKIAIYGFSGQNVEYCSSHRTNGMIDMKHSICKKEGCKNRAYYSYFNYNPIYCSKHKQDGMNNLNRKKKWCEIKNISNEIPVVKEMMKDETSSSIHIKIDTLNSSHNSHYTPKTNKDENINLDETFDIIENFLTDMMFLYLVSPELIKMVMATDVGKELMAELDEFKKIF